jgi:hypothetical protein
MRYPTRDDYDLDEQSMHETGAMTFLESKSKVHNVIAVHFAQG